MDLDRRMHAAGRRAADQQRNVEALALHFGGDMHHLVERGRDQAGKPDDVDIFLFGGLENVLGRHHDAKIDDLVIVAGENDADDVLADVVHVALDRRHQDLAGAAAALRVAAGGLFFFHVGQEIGHGLLHHAGGLDHLGQEHLALAEKVADDVHAVHQRAFDDMERALGAWRGLLGIGLDIFGDAVDQRMGDALLDRLLAPGEILGPGFAAAPALVALGKIEQAFGGIGAAVEDHVLAGLAQFGLDRFIDGELAGIDDAHVHAGLDGMVEKHRVHGLAHGSLPRNEKERLETPPEMWTWGRVSVISARRLDEIDAVIVVLFDAGGDREDVGIEDDVFGRKPDLVHENAIGARADLDLALLGVGLAALVERHDDDGRAIEPAQPGMVRGRRPRLP